MSTIALIDTRLKIPGESIGTVVSTHDTIRAAFKTNEAFQKRMRDGGVKDHVPTKNVTLKYNSATVSVIWGIILRNFWGDILRPWSHALLRLNGNA